MANTDISYLRQFNPNDFMLWSVCSQCYNTFTVTIKDDRKTYAVVPKTTTSTSLQKLTQASAFYEGGNNLRIEVKFDDGRVDVKKAQAAGAILDVESNTVGFSYTFCIEDGTDEDYNDVYIAIVAWKKKG